ncbi:thioredoxin [Photobacterium rosenbergii]|uniref:Thioredoxin n=1 Tax=Photobacterium rosenbergii TaxID=294936 RepID=A0A2T3NJW3_9GAMM|nr:DsbA family oxidoreductase [Photobacterium rosenbergii]PSW15797.1 thioredoxin [Photobacterium rosenbergii]
MADKIKLDIISDVVCPWCIIGYKRLEEAINELGIADKVEIEWQPFELNPQMPAEGENLREHVLRKYGSNREDSERARTNIKVLGAEHDFSFNYSEDMRMVNTFDAHMLLDLAHEQGLQHQLKQRLFAAFFSEHKDVSDRQVLLAEAGSVGIEADTSVFEDESRTVKIRSLEQQWRQLGIEGVPTVIINRESAITGAHPVENYKQVLSQVLEAN